MTILTTTGTRHNANNTATRVDAINARYQREIIRDCPGVVSVGVSDAAIIRGERQGKRHLPPASKLHEPVIAVGVKARKYLPKSPVFLQGVSLLFQVTGPAHRVSSSIAPRCSKADYRPRVGAQGATASLVGMTGVVLHGSTQCLLHTRLTFAVQEQAGGGWRTVRMVGNPTHAELSGLLKPGGSTGRDWAWWNYCGPHGRFRFQASAGGHSATTSVTPPFCNSSGTGPGAIRPFPPRRR